MAEMRKRTSMSVLEMGRMLGLGKTESYWLIKKNYFKTILVGNTMRVMIDSFEEWYANQFKYQKVDGTPPGEELKKTTYSMEELGQRLGLKEATAYELVAKGHFDVVDVLGKRRVTKESFERWYASQTDYRTVEDQELDADIMASTYGLPEMARMLGVHRQTIYCALPGFVDSKNEEKTERNAGYLVVSQSGGGMLRQGTREGIRRTPANRGMRAHRIVKGLDISEDVCHGMCP